MSSNQEILDRLSVIETQLEALTNLLPEKERDELENNVARIKDNAWERRMGEDL
jgi:hypothetical protein